MNGTPPSQSFTVFGNPAGQGSKRIVRTKRGRSVMLESSIHLMPWRSTVSVAAMEAGIHFSECGWVRLDITVRWPRPSSHFNKKGLKPNAPRFPGKVDGDKLVRGIFDALTGIAYRDDRQVAQHSMCREWCADGVPTHAEIRVSHLDA